MQKYNKAYAGGIGAAVAVILSWATEAFLNIGIPGEVEGAMAIIFAAVGPLIGPANQE